MTKIELVGSTTIVSELVGNDGSAIEQKYYINTPVDFHLESEAVIFPGQEALTKMAIRFDDLTTATETLLGGASTDQQDMLDNFATASLFQGK